MVAIVGSRRATKYGEQIAYKLAYDLAKMGIIVVSGLAYGIDACAHRGCLDAGGVTVAVLGTPIDQIYPRSNSGLAERILEKGAIISEYPVGHETRAYHFLERNRIVTGLAKAVVVVEASVRSGTMTTASYANEQGRELYVVPGDINRPMSRGCNNMLQYAHAYVDFDSFIRDVFGIEVQTCAIAKLSTEQSEIVRLIREGSRDGEEIARTLGMDTASFNRNMTALELKGIVRALGANQWTFI